jgi:uncharacterized membrane protein (DUF106 family)
MTAELISALVAVIMLIGAIITVWLNLNLKVKELDVKILNMENKLKDFKEDIKEERDEIIRTIEKQNDKLWQKLEQIETKIDDKFKDLATLQAEHKNNMCQYKNNLK